MDWILVGFLDDFADLGTLMKSFGPLFVAVMFFMWRDYRREDRLTTRIDALEDEQRNVILPLVEETAKVITKNTEVLQRLEQALDRR